MNAVRIKRLAKKYFEINKYSNYIEEALLGKSYYLDILKSKGIDTSKRNLTKLKKYISIYKAVFIKTCQRLDSFDSYIAKEVYSVKGGLQGDGRDYFTYQFTEEKGKEINGILKENQSWSKEKLDENAMGAFEYNEEVNSIENGYYYYKRICRTSDERKKYNFTDEEATGWEIGIYDIDNNMLYYYWESI